MSQVFLLQFQKWEPLVQSNLSFSHWLQGWGGRICPWTQDWQENLTFEANFSVLMWAVFHVLSLVGRLYWRRLTEIRRYNCRINCWSQGIWNAWKKAANVKQDCWFGEISDVCTCVQFPGAGHSGDAVHSGSTDVSHTGYRTGHCAVLAHTHSTWTLLKLEKWISWRSHVNI